jgi:hypothetical protein
VRLLALVADIGQGPPADLLRLEDVSTMDRLRGAGFSDRMIDRVWRPLAGGIELDPTLSVSRRRFDVVLRMLATGDAAVPARGIGRIPELLAARLAPEVIRYETPVDAVEGTTAVLADGARVTGRTLVVATDGPAAARLLGLPSPDSLAAGCCWFAADTPPVDEPYLILDGEQSGPAANVVPLSVVAPEYAPPGRALVAAAVPGPAALEPTSEARGATPAAGLVRHRGRLLGAAAGRRHPPRPAAQRPPFDPVQTVRLGDGRYVCGDHRTPRRARARSTRGAAPPSPSTRTSSGPDRAGRRISRRVSRCSCRGSG